ncbi:hypothetical protein ACFWUZ_19345 [Streptomyces sp. NPDC058646]
MDVSTFDALFSASRPALVGFACTLRLLSRGRGDRRSAERS